ncbi:MAG: DUF2071 domain-containing protein [Sphingobacteriales bacterium]|nr:DUF2071 domain-containing protein [Sphingobacteriales bacterium]
MKKIFLTAAWTDLVMANYKVDPQLLAGYLPPHTEPDLYNHTCYISLVGFMFRDVRLKGCRIPFHTHFPEVNLRFYVRYKEEGNWKRGVVFISEIVPKRAVAWVANTIFREHYSSLPMGHYIRETNKSREAGYHWKKNGRLNRLEVIAGSLPVPLIEGSFEEFITEHFWGYAAAPGGGTVEYQVAHPRWNIYPVREYRVDCDFGSVYGKRFELLQQEKPETVFLAEGSPVEVFTKRLL